MAVKAGRASSRSRASPPTMMARVPSSAPPTPPDTGASMKRTPRSPSRAAKRREVPGSTVDMSTQSRPAAMPSATPRAPKYARSTCGDEGSIVTTRSLSSPPHRAAEVAGAGAHADRGGERRRLEIVGHDAEPLGRRFRAIGRPMAPVPMNPTFISLVLLGS